ncbi:MAG: glycoside hydrolase family 5 protein [Saprospiraceae bacterium]|nr:glycoside hydrolase family 5 protein [Saprospiraceae bacterium]
MCRKTLSNGIIAVFSVLFFLSNNSIYGQESSKAYFSIKGHDLYDPSGNKFLIQGINLGNWLNPEGYMFLFKNTSSARLIDQAFRELVGPDFTDEFWKLYKDHYITEEDIRFIKETGINSIRVPFHYKLFTDEDYMGLTGIQDGFERMDRLLSWCRKSNLYVILDMHDAPGGQTGDNIDDSYGYPWLMVSEKSQKLFVDIWTKIGERYSNEEMIIGYDLLNEPIATYFEKEYNVLNPALEPLYMRAVKSIRNADKNHIILLGGAQWNSNFTVFSDSKFDDKIMYTCHRYWCDTLQQNIQDFVDFRDSVNLPLYMGETGENTDQWISAWTRLMIKNNIGYHYWPYKKMKNPSCMVSIKEPENWDKIVEYAERPRNTFSEIRSHRPDQMIVRKAMLELIENMKFKNCHVNDAYVKAIGM